MFVKQFKINFDEIVALWFAFEWTFQISWKKNAEVLLKSQNLIYGNLPIYKVLHSEGSFRILGIKVTKNKTMEIKQNYLSLSFLSAFVLCSQEHRGNIPIKRIVVWSFNKDLNSNIVVMSIHVGFLSYSDIFWASSICHKLLVTSQPRNLVFWTFINFKLHQIIANQSGNYIGKVYTTLTFPSSNQFIQNVYSTIKVFSLPWVCEIKSTIEEIMR